MMPTKGIAPMHKTLLCTGLLAALTATAQAGPLEIHGMGISRDLSCHGQDVDITGNANQINLSGQCGVVVVHGSEHEVSLGDAAALEVSGVDNQVRAGTLSRLIVATGGNRIHATLQAKQPPAQVEVTGSENVLELQFDGPAKVDLSGVEHQLHWRGQDPVIETTGSGHRIERR